MGTYAYYNYQFTRIAPPPAHWEFFSTTALSIYSDESFAHKQEILSKMWMVDSNCTREIVLEIQTFPNYYSE